MDSSSCRSGRASARSAGWAMPRRPLPGSEHHTTPLDIFQASLEAIAYRFAALYDALQRGGETIVASGGGLRQSPSWLQMMADAIGQPVVASFTPEASLRGAALRRVTKQRNDR